MSMTDPIADMLTRIRNALAAGHHEVQMPFSKEKGRIVEILKREGYINDFNVPTDKQPLKLCISLKWSNGQPAIAGISRVSKPGQRRYARCREIPQVRNGLGIMIVSTSKGMMTDHHARKSGVGGELVCSIW